MTNNRPKIDQYFKDLTAEYTKLMREADEEPLRFFPSSQALQRGKRWRQIEEEIKQAGYKMILANAYSGYYKIEYA